MTGAMIQQPIANSQLIINLSHLRDNYHYIQLQCAPAQTAAVLKADAYGFGMDYIIPVLEQAGCVWFFVADWSEACRAQAILKNPASRIAVLGGCADGFMAQDVFVPVVYSLEQLKSIIAGASPQNKKIPIILHLDTGLSRLGLSADEIKTLQHNKHLLDHVDIVYWMSHCVEPDTKQCTRAIQQLQQLKEMINGFPAAPITFSNSGIFSLDNVLKADLIRSGESLYGVTAFTDQLSGLKPVLSWQAKILKTATAYAGDSFGYDAGFVAENTMDYAVIGVGYADGLMAKHAPDLCFYLNDYACPVLGHIAMDLTIIDITAVPADMRSAAQTVDILGPYQDLNKLADGLLIGPHVIMAHLSRRAARSYIE